jgi:hypothetical protein
MPKGQKKGPQSVAVTRYEYLNEEKNERSGDLGQCSPDRKSPSTDGEPLARHRLEGQPLAYSPPERGPWLPPPLAALAASVSCVRGSVCGGEREEWQMG